MCIRDRGDYSPCVPELVEAMGSEIYAVILQTILCGLLGSSFAASSVIWEIDHWSILKQSAIYFLIASAVMMPVAYLTNWMDHSLIGFAGYFGVFFVIFIAVWVIQYAIWKNKIKKMNAKLK